MDCDAKYIALLVLFMFINYAQIQFYFIFCFSCDKKKFRNVHTKNIRKNTNVYKMSCSIVVLINVMINVNYKANNCSMKYQNNVDIKKLPRIYKKHWKFKCFKKALKIYYSPSYCIYFAHCIDKCCLQRWRVFFHICLLILVTIKHPPPLPKHLFILFFYFKTSTVHRYMLTNYY